MPSRRRLAKCSTQAASAAISVRASSQAAPRPTTSGWGSVPERRPRSWPPPEISGSRRTRGRRRTNSAPMPLGPYSLWPDSDSKSMHDALTSSGTLPAICAASVWKATPAARQSAPISASGCTTPISLFTPMIDTRAVSGARAAATADGATSPSVPTGKYVTRKPPPDASSHRQASRTHLCSVCVVTTCFLPAAARNRATPLTARLFDSVAPDVKTISRGSARKERRKDKLVVRRFMYGVGGGGDSDMLS